MSLSDDDLADSAIRWWKRFRPLAGPAQTEQVVRDFVATIPWIAPRERFEVASRVAALVRQRAARKAAITRKKKAKAAREAAERARQYKLPLSGA